jgi:hypothetical protein
MLMLAIKLGRRVRLCALAGVVTFTAFGASFALAVPGAEAATVRTCQGGGAGYTVTVPQTTGSTAGVDPNETSAVDCTIGYHEKKGYPFSLVGLVLVVTAATLILLYWKKDSLDLQSGGNAFDVAGGDR